MHYKTVGTCSTAIDLEIENGIITACAITGGCKGNTTGLCRMVIGRRAEDVRRELAGIPCHGDTSCPDQLSRAITQYLQKQN